MDVRGLVGVHHHGKLQPRHPKRELLSHQPQTHDDFIQRLGLRFLGQLQGTGSKKGEWKSQRRSKCWP